MEVRAVAKFVKVQPRKVRLVAAQVRGKAALSSADVLRFHPSKGAHTLRKVLLSAIANAQENHGASPDSLRIVRIQVDEGPHQKRIIARAMGRANRILKKTSHITVVVEESDAPAKTQKKGTAAKPRPKFAAPKPKKAAKKQDAAGIPAEEQPEEAMAASEAPEPEALEPETQAMPPEAAAPEAQEPEGQVPEAQEPGEPEPAPAEAPEEAPEEAGPADEADGPKKEEA